ncbi:hypothetical protein TNCV_815161 [Trichonephila clavipes]|nr:hypothetical protein TNCV_815161 [Trichonephila clavipes]
MRRTRQEGPVRSRGSREHQYSPYIEEQARSAGRKTKSRKFQQQHFQERKGGARERERERTADGPNLSRFP